MGGPSYVHRFTCRLSYLYINRRPTRARNVYCIRPNANAVPIATCAYPMRCPIDRCRTERP